MIIGITGTLGSGKGSVVDYLVKKKGFQYLSVTGFMKSVAESRGITPDRMTYRNIANEFRAKSPTGLAEAVMEEGRKRGITDNFVIEAQHAPAEVRFIQSKGGIEIAVDADLNIRFERISKRGSEKDQTTFEAFAKHEQEEMKSDDPNKNNLAAAIAAADYRIENNGTREELHARIDEVLADIRPKK